jgi:hypothetical protein
MYNENYSVVEYDNDIDYRTNLLKLFNLEEFDIDIINKIIHTLYVKHCDNEKIKVLMRGANTMTDDNELGLMMLFSYDYLYLFNSFLLSGSDVIYSRLLDKLHLK